MYAYFKTHSKLFLCIALLLTLVVLPFAATAQEGETERTGFRPDAPPYAVRGAYAVGTMDFVLEDEERPLNGMIWYPALNPDGVEEATVYDAGLGDMMPPAFNDLEGKAIRDAAPDAENGPYPLVVWSHGSGSALAVTPYIFEHLASHGFVVIGVTHLDNSLPNFMAGFSDPEQQVIFDENNFLHLAHRPLDMLRQIAYAETLTAAGGDLEGVIDMERMASAGYSYGGWTALMTGGAQLDIGAFREWCEQDAFGSASASSFCEQLDDESRIIELAGVAVQPGEIWPALADPRVDAVVSIDPGPIPTLGIAGLEAVEVPTLLLATTEGGWVSLEHNAERVYEYLGSSDRSLAVFENSEHLAFLQCNETWTTAFFGFCSDAVWDIDRFHDLTNHFTTAFLMSVLYEDAEAAAALAPDAVVFPGIRYETTQ